MSQFNDKFKKRQSSPRMPKKKPDPELQEDTLHPDPYRWDEDLCYQEALAETLRRHGKISTDD